MSSQKKLAVIFLAAVNLINIAAGITVQLKIFFGSDVISIIPIKAELTVNQILLLNFLCVVAVITLINIVVTCLAVDVPYSPFEIISNCAGIFVVPSVIIFLTGLFNAVRAPITADKIFIIASGIFYVLSNIINTGCIITIREDA